MGRSVEITDEAYNLIAQQKVEGYPIKRLASEPIIEKYKPLMRAAETAAKPMPPPARAAEASAKRSPIPAMAKVIQLATEERIPEDVAVRWYEWNERLGWKITYWESALRKYWAKEKAKLEAEGQGVENV